MTSEVVNFMSNKASKKQTLSVQLAPEIIERFDLVMEHYQRQSLTELTKSDILRILIDTKCKEITEGKDKEV